MNHLTTKEIFQIVDGTIANGERSKLILHLEACERCSREVRFQRNIGRIIKEAPLTNPSKGFTASVLGKIAPERKKSIVSILLNNLGSILAMAMVLTVVWYAVTLTPPAKSATESSAMSKAFGVYVEYYAKARDAITKGYVSAVGTPSNNQTSRTTEVTALTVLSILILVAIDRFVVRRVIRAPV